MDLEGKYLMPGLINLHVHLAGNGKPQKKQRDNEKLVRRLMGTGLSRAAAYHVVAGFARLEVMSGVTTIRTVGGLGDFDTRLRDEIAAGKRPGPRILAANEGISVPGTTIHVFYAERMGKKYLARYRKHFRDPVIYPQDLQHEELPACRPEGWVRLVKSILGTPEGLGEE